MADPGWIATALLVAALAAGGFIEEVFLLLATLGPSGRVLWARGGYLVHLSPFRARMKISAISSIEIVTERRGFGKRSYILIRSNALVGRGELALISGEAGPCGSLAGL